MRVTERMMMDNAIRNMAANKEKLHELQNRVASGKLFEHASDSPSRASLSMNVRSTLEINESYYTTAKTSHEWVTATENAFGQMMDAADKAVALATKGINETFGPKERQQMAIELDGLIKSSIEIGNTSHMGQFVFGGHQIQDKPFAIGQADVDGDGTLEDVINFSGDNGEMRRDISPGHTITINTNGDTAFRDFMESMIEARDALIANDTEALEDSLGNLQASYDQMNQYRATNAARQRQLETTMNNLEKTKLELNAVLNKNEDADMIEAISLMRNQETAFQTVLEVGQRAISALNLFEVLR